MDWNAILLAAIPLILAAVVGFIFARWAEPLKAIKDIYAGQPIYGILAAAVVMISEAVWSNYGGAAQFAKACEMLGELLGGVLSADEVEVIVQKAYETLRALLDEHWGALKLDLAGQF